MKQIIFAALFLAGISMSFSADAQGRYYTKKHHQSARIHDGVRHGSLTRVEARELRQQQRAIRTHKRIALADGRITPRERQIIRREQMKAGRNIYREKHDRQYRRY